MKDEREIKTLSRVVLKAYLENKDYQTVEEYLSHSVAWVEIGQQDIYTSLPKVHSFFEKKKSSYNDNMKIVHEEYITHMINEDSGIIISTLILHSHMDQCTNEITLRNTIVWVKENEQWKIVHVHICHPQDALNNEHLSMEESNDTALKMKQAVLLDNVTHINNMEGFVEEARSIFEVFPQYRYAVVKFGIKDFRYINRTFGYTFGDSVLANIGKNLQRTCQEYETCGRMEKDIFAILYRFTYKKDFDKRMHEVRMQLLDDEFLDKIGNKVHFTAGVYIPENIHKESVKSMLDKALLAKMSIENDKYDYYSYFEKKMLEEKEENSKILEMAPLAMKNNEFQLFIQPQFDIHTKEIVGGEALTRWKHQHQVIMPNHFIPLFEENGYINEFDFYMLEKLCQTMRQWMLEGKRLVPVSINQSRRHLNEEGYIDKFTRIVDSYSIPHRYIVFELTESAFVKYENLMKKVSKQLHKLGYLLAIDDFGTGYASLNFLSQITADILKIDKSLIDNYKNNKKTHTIVEKVIDMAHGMDMKVVCEGIEVQEQVEYLKALKCDVGQGYVIGKPVEAEIFKKVWLLPK